LEIKEPSKKLLEKRNLGNKPGKETWKTKPGKRNLEKRNLENEP